MEFPGVAVVTGAGGSGIGAAVARAFVQAGCRRVALTDYSGGGIRLNCVCPGIIATPMTEEAPGQRSRSLQKEVLKRPLKRFGTPEEIVDSVLFLYSSKASFIQGHALVADGGYTLV